MPYSWSTEVTGVTQGKQITNEGLNEIKSVADYVYASHCPANYSAVKTANDSSNRVDKVDNTSNNVVCAGHYTANYSDRSYDSDKSYDATYKAYDATNKSAYDASNKTAYDGSNRSGYQITTTVY